MILTAALCKEIDLAQNTSLKSISLHSLVLYSDSPGSRSYSWIIDILSQITSLFIERVTLVVFLHTPQEVTSLNLPALAALFDRGNTTFAERLTRLQFTIYGDVDRMEARAAITDGLRDLNSQGRLEFGGYDVGWI